MYRLTFKKTNNHRSFCQVINNGIQFNRKLKNYHHRYSCILRFVELKVHLLKMRDQLITVVMDSQHKLVAAQKFYNHKINH